MNCWSGWRRNSPLGPQTAFWRCSGRWPGRWPGTRWTGWSIRCNAPTRAHRDGAGEEMVVAALLHDIGDLLAPFNHSELAAAVLRPYVAERTCWIVGHHGLFQTYYYAHHTGRRPQCPRRLPGPSLVPGHGGVLPPLGPVVF